MNEYLTIFDFLEQSDEKSVRKIDNSDAIPFIMNIHYARRIPCIQYAFGLFKGEKIIGVVTYGQPPSPNVCIGLAGKENRDRVLELNRLVMLPSENEKNNASYLVGRSLKMLPDGTYVVSYADWGGWHHVGYVYQATNFLYTGMTKERTDLWSEGHSRHYRKGETNRKNRTSKHRYIYIYMRRRRKTGMQCETLLNGKCFLTQKESLEDMTQMIRGE